MIALPIHLRRQLTVDIDGCWIFNGRVTRNGYGICEVAGETLAHRGAYRVLVGPIASELQLDHTCNNKRCVNPAHLEQVTAGENSRRRSARLLVCPNGHKRSGNGECIECRRARDRRTKAKRRGMAVHS